MWNFAASRGNTLAEFQVMKTEFQKSPEFVTANKLLVHIQTKWKKNMNFAVKEKEPGSGSLLTNKIYILIYIF